MTTLFDVPPIVFRATLAVALRGANEAILVQLIADRVRRHGKTVAGERWWQASGPSIRELLPWLSDSTIRRTLLDLKAQEFIVIRRPANEANLYRLNIPRLDELARTLK